MYVFPEMIDLGLSLGEDWKSPKHRIVAQNIALGNPNVRQRDTLAEICQIVNSVAMDRIETVTYRELVDEFGMPDIGIFR